MCQPLVEVIKTRKVGKNGYANMIQVLIIDLREIITSDVIYLLQIIKTKTMN